MPENGHKTKQTGIRFSNEAQAAIAQIREANPDLKSDTAAVERALIEYAANLPGKRGTPEQRAYAQGAEWARQHIDECVKMVQRGDDTLEYRLENVALVAVGYSLGAHFVAGALDTAVDAAKEQKRGDYDRGN